MKWKPRLGVAPLIFLCAFAVRVAYVLQLRDLPWFDVPLVDGATYFQTARLIASGQWLGGTEVFWQPPLYPYFIAVLLRVLGENLLAIYAVQAAVGAASCVLVHRIARRVFSERAARWAAGIAALYGPLVFFDGQPLMPVVHISLLLAGLLALLQAAGVGEGETPRPRAWAAAGLLWGLSAIATPNVLACVPFVAAWAWRRRVGARAAVLFVLGLALPVLTVTARNRAVSGDWVLISSNGGLNFYLGNNADAASTVALRSAAGL